MGLVCFVRSSYSLLLASLAVEKLGRWTHFHPHFWSRILPADRISYRQTTIDTHCGLSSSNVGHTRPICNQVRSFTHTLPFFWSVINYCQSIWHTFSYLFFHPKHRFFFCEFIALANVCIQFVFLNRFFNGLFYTYGYDVTRYNWLPDHEQQQQVNPATLLFPKVSKCRYLNYGSAGEIVTIDALCILSINVINEKIYLFIWFWFVLLIVLTTLMLTVHLALICCNQVRFCFLTVRLDCVQPMTDARQTLAQLRLGDWFLLYLLSQNLDCLCFGQLLKAYLDRVNRQMNEGGGDLASVSGPWFFLSKHFYAFIVISSFLRLFLIVLFFFFFSFSNSVISCFCTLNSLCELHPSAHKTN